jgi:hypothetical protein
VNLNKRFWVLHDLKRSIGEAMAIEILVKETAQEAGITYLEKTWPI